MYPTASIRSVATGSRATRCARRWIFASLALALASGCGTISGQAREVREKLVGGEVGALRRCLGSAPYLEIQEDGSELWGYTSGLSGRPADIQITRAVGPATAFQRPRVEAGDPVERRGIQNEFSEQPISPGQCLYLFEIRDGVVASLDTRGRTFTNLNADAQCTAQLRICLPRPEPSR